MEYIEREAAVNAVLNLVPKVDCDGYCWVIRGDAARAIDSIPAADVRPVVRGNWIGYPECLKYPNAYADDHIVCSACEECFSILDNDCERFNFCPNCGADMGES